MVFKKVQPGDEVLMVGQADYQRLHVLLNPAKHGFSLSHKRLEPGGGVAAEIQNPQRNGVGDFFEEDNGESVELNDPAQFRREVLK
jgi:hypothetical protein